MMYDAAMEQPAPAPSVAHTTSIVQQKPNPRYSNYPIQFQLLAIDSEGWAVAFAIV
jgi:hypothetical protein